MSTPHAAYWSAPADALLRGLRALPNGLSSSEAAERLATLGCNAVEELHTPSRVGIAWRQIRSPLILLLLFAACVSAATDQWVDALIVGAIVFVTVGIGYLRESKAQAAAQALAKRLESRATVLRDGRQTSVGVDTIVPGDVVLLAAGTMIPADGILLEATDFYVSEAILTGESYPVVKQPGVVEASAPLGRRTNTVFLGTNVRSGTARCLVVATGLRTEFGKIAHRLALRPPETEFDRGVRRFGYLLVAAMSVLVLVVFTAHVVAGRPAVETLLFAVALAVGLSPELLPAILTVNLARGADEMAQRGVLVRRLPAIENLGSMDVLCTDKTGTLTEGAVQLEGSYDVAGAPSSVPLELAALNAAFETGVPSPLDDAILAAHAPRLARIEKRGEIPFDSLRKRVSIVVERADGVLLVTKGAFRTVLGVCTRLPDGAPIDAAARARLDHAYEAWSARGIRVVAVATRYLPPLASYHQADERELTLVGFLTFLDRPKESAAAALTALARLGVAVKIITGDGLLVARQVASAVGLSAERVLTGSQLDGLSDEALWHAAERTELFAEVDANQKERIILALKKMGHVVGFLGDGVNDAPAMHAADTSLSVEGAVDVARAAADFILLERDLDVIRRGIAIGRKTFANTLKYVLTTSSANLGNMVSMAAASLFLPFFPLLAGQILLNNFISDIPAIGIADDHVDPEQIERPRRWDMRFIGHFMVEFGLLSSAFDVMTFAALIALFAAPPELFRTAWFVESLLTELVIALVVRTRRPFYRSRPGRVLLISTLVLIPGTFALPFLPYARALGFVPLPATVLGALTAITVLYVLAADALKARFYRAV